VLVPGWRAGALQAVEIIHRNSVRFAFYCKRHRPTGKSTFRVRKSDDAARCCGNAMVSRPCHAGDHQASKRVALGEERPPVTAAAESLRTIRTRVTTTRPPRASPVQFLNGWIHSLALRACDAPARIPPGWIHLLALRACDAPARIPPGWIHSLALRACDAPARISPWWIHSLALRACDAPAGGIPSSVCNAWNNRGACATHHSAQAFEIAHFHGPDFEKITIVS
jgi:hypothetical protein